MKDVIDNFFDRYFKGDALLIFVIGIGAMLSVICFLIGFLLSLTNAPARDNLFVFPLYVLLIVWGPFTPSIIARIVYNMKYGCNSEEWDMYIQDRYFTIKLVNSIVVFIIIALIASCSDHAYVGGGLRDSIIHGI